MTIPFFRSAWLVFCACLLQAGCAIPAAPRASHSGGLSRGPASFAGFYAGTWQSVSGHHGKLTCQFTPADGPHYRAHFTAWWLAFHTSYDTLFTTAREGATLTFAGEQDLGKLRGGIYHYHGSITRGQWRAQYTATGDRGTFTMVRE